MGRLIDADEVKKKYPIMENDFGMVINERLHKGLDEIPTVEAISKADYEARLKADMVAMLTDIQISVAELDFSWMCDYADGDCIKRYAVVDIIQEKINALKGDQQQDEKIDTSKSDQGKVY